MKRDICTRCERAMTDHDWFDGARAKIRDRFREPTRYFTSRRKIRSKHDLCASCASDLDLFMRGRPLAPMRPPAVGGVPSASGVMPPNIQAKGIRNG